MGRGYVYEPSISKLIPNQDVVLKKITGGWFKKWGLCNNIDAFFERYAVTDEFKFSELSDEAKDRFLYGFNISEGREFIGLLKAVENYERFKVQQGTAYEYQLRKMGEMVVCKECLGYRLCKEALQITVARLHIGQLSGLTMAELTQLLDNCSKEFEMTREGKNIVQNIQRYAENFTNVGLPYLTTNRPLPTLSGGEAQRLLLVSHLQSKMDSVMYIFDEPTAGLHETEKKRLVDQLYSLKERGNSVIVVEHDKRMIQRAEHIIDIGPLAGEHGGHIEFNGKLEGLQKNAKSITGTYLSNKISVPLKKETDRKRVTDETLRLRVTKAWTNNLKGVAVNIPLGMMVGIAGVSGSGKSSLISHTLVPLLKSTFGSTSKRNLHDTEEDYADPLQLFDSTAQLEGTEQLQGYSEVTQDPIGRINTSIPLTYMKVWDRIRKKFASLSDAADRGFTTGSFSFNSDGACQGCEGKGYTTHYIGDREFISECSECKGKRYREEVLQVRYKGKTIADILEMSATEGASFFKEDKSICFALQVLDQTGMGYIRLGQATRTLSGGEAQRIKLVKELGRKRKGSILYILDEPTTSLSLYDTSKLMRILDQLVTQGHSLIICEHDIEVLSYCDWMIEMGPDSGGEGGEVIAEGSPEDLSRNPNSKIGPYLLTHK
jgi:excinuclease ABC subunit A